MGGDAKKRKCKLEAAFKSMHLEQALEGSPSTEPSDEGNHVRPSGGGGGGGGGGGSHHLHLHERKLKRAADEERKRREEVEFLVHLICWGPNN
ncbi:hypothetical protein SAY87_021265 [Trapa incisa]|uniref:Uncharacterized protein n=1 Tax=Trapa incisa TaxID=236973 RepID=A0AAN7JT26_9MYRT|nr:hypothetical protein SAY87_021265 [Trapa incisa]